MKKTTPGGSPRPTRRRSSTSQEDEEPKTIQDIMTQEERVQERIDAEGHRWRKIYVGGGEHFRNWLAQCSELGEVMVEAIDSKGYRCFEEAGEGLYRIWLKVGSHKDEDDLKT